MLDTSDRAVFNSGYDPAMGTTGFSVDVSDAKSVLCAFNSARRQLILTNAGAGIVYISLTANVSEDLYSLRLRPNAFVAVSDYGGTVTAICEAGQTSKIYVTDVH